MMGYSCDLLWQFQLSNIQNSQRLAVDVWNVLGASLRYRATSAQLRPYSMSGEDRLC